MPELLEPTIVTPQPDTGSQNSSNSNSNPSVSMGMIRFYTQITNTRQGILSSTSAQYKN